MQAGTGPSDERSVNYLVQYQPHLDATQVFIPVDGSISQRTAQVSVSLVNVVENLFSVSMNLGASSSGLEDPPQDCSWTVILPYGASQAALTVTATLYEGVCDFKIPARRTPPAEVSLCPRLSATELQNFAPEHIYCRFCSSLLVTLADNVNDPPSNSLFRPLPSPHYQEMIEAYLCHPSGEFARQMNDVGEKGFWPEGTTVDGQVRSLVLVGETELRVDIKMAQSWLKLPSDELVSVSVLDHHEPILYPYHLGTKEGLKSPLCGNPWPKDRYKSPRSTLPQAKTTDRRYHFD
jgi:hypothetical protein